MTDDRELNILEVSPVHAGLLGIACASLLMSKHYYHSVEQGDIQASPIVTGLLVVSALLLAGGGLATLIRSLRMTGDDLPPVQQPVMIAQPVYSEPAKPKPLSTSAHTPAAPAA